MAFYKHWKKFFFAFPATIITNTATISHRHFYEIELERFDRKTLIIKHNVVGSELVGIWIKKFISI
jgi:hypothetical protein